MRHWRSFSPAEKADLVRPHAEAGLTCTEIADRIALPGCTRNAVIGVANRNKIRLARLTIWAQASPEEKRELVLLAIRHGATSDAAIARTIEGANTDAIRDCRIRHGIASPYRGVQSRAWRVKNGVTPKQRAKKPQIVWRPPHERPKPTPPVCEPLDGGILWVDRRQDQCAFIGDDKPDVLERLCCGRRTSHGPWCDEHYRLAYLQGRDAREAVREIERTVERVVG